MTNPLGAYVRKAQNIESVRARHDLLLAGIEAPGKVSPLVLKALQTQHSFAKFALKGTRVNALCRNTLITLARNIYSQEAEDSGDGYLYLDALRRKLKGLVESRTSTRSIEAKSKRRDTSTENLKDLLKQTEQQNIRQSRAYSDLTSKLNTFLREEWVDNGTKQRIASILVKHQSIYSDLFSPGEAGNLTADNVLPLIK